MKNRVPKCLVCGQKNMRGSGSKYCCGDCKRKADRRNKIKKNK